LLALENLRGGSTIAAKKLAFDEKIKKTRIRLGTAKSSVAASERSLAEFKEIHGDEFFKPFLPAGKTIADIATSQFKSGYDHKLSKLQ
jgi:hypothetical protein